MNYPEIEMEDTGRQEPQPSEPAEERDNRIAQHESELLGDIAQVLPELSEDQVKRLYPVVTKHATRTVDTEDEGGYDYLTKLLNRRGFYRRLDNEIRRTARTSHETETNIIGRGCLLYIDLDFYGEVNKVFGDEVGDEVLRQVTKVFGNTRPEDIAARWGGEEFLIYAPDNLEGAIRMAARLQQRIVEEVSFPDPNRKQTLSIGISQIPSGITIQQILDQPFRENELFPRQINEASVAMRKGAKERGRNKIAVIDDAGYIQTVIFKPDLTNPAQMRITYQPVTGI